MSQIPKPSKTNQRADEFVTSFGRARALILKRIENLKQGEDLNSKLTVLSNDIQEMSSSLHDATLFLSSYSIKMRQDEIRELENTLKAKEDLLIPPKKFGFKPKIQQPKSTNSEIAEGSSRKQLKESPSEIPEQKSAPTEASSSNYFTIENVSNKTLTHEESELARNDVLIRNIENSTLNLNGSPSTMRLVKLTGCKLLCGPVFTSIFIEDCRDCVFFLSCQQLRVHSSEALDIYLRVRSRAVIEDCSLIRFGPYTWNHPKSTQLHGLTEIGETLERFDCVDDFNWLAFNTPSPNWSIIPISERITSIEPSNPT